MTLYRGGSDVSNATGGVANTAQELLDKIKTVDGEGSGLDADLLKGNAPTATGITYLTGSTGFVEDSHIKTGTKLNNRITDIVYATDHNAVGDAVTDDTEALQAAFNVFKDPDTTNLPGPINFKNRLFDGRILDLGGRTYNVTAPLDYSGCHGIILQNGTLIATGASWVSGDAVLKNSTGFCIRPTFRNLVIECNEKTNGIYIDRGVYGVLEDVSVYGFWNQQYAIKATASTGAGYTSNLYFKDVKCWGTIAAETKTLSSTPTGIGIDIDNSDCEVEGGETSRCLIGIKLTSSGNIRGHHFTGYSVGGVGEPNAVGLLLENITRQRVIGCFFDHAILRCYPRETTIIGNQWAFLSYNATKAVELKSVGASDTLNDFVFEGNYGHINGATSLITLDEVAGTFTTMKATKVTDNVFRDTSGNPLANQRETKGIITASIGATAWNGIAVEVDLSNHLLLPTATNARFQAAITGYADSGNAGTPACTGYLYDNTTGKLKIYFSHRFTGRCSIAYEWGETSNLIAAAAPASGKEHDPVSVCLLTTANKLDVTGAGTVYQVDFDSARYDPTFIGDTTNNRITIKVPGVYQLQGQIMLDGLTSAADEITARIVTTSGTIENRIVHTNSLESRRTIRIDGPMDLNEGDTITMDVVVTGEASNVVDVLGNTIYRTYLSATLIH